jgi:hypothetical protein
VWADNETTNDLPAEWATTTFDLVPLDWARRWPAEVVRKARRRR